MAKKKKGAPRPKVKPTPGQLPKKGADGPIAGALKSAGSFGKATNVFPGK